MGPAPVSITIWWHEEKARGRAQIAMRRREKAGKPAISLAARDGAFSGVIACLFLLVALRLLQQGGVILTFLGLTLVMWGLLGIATALAILLGVRKRL